MIKKRIQTQLIKILLLICGLMSFYSVTYASVATDRLSDCLVKSTTETDQKVVLQWTFVALSNHPDLQVFRQITPEQQESLNKNLAQVLQRILVDQCANETKAVIQTDGLQAVGTSFQKLGQITGEKILKTPEINEQYKGIIQYLDLGKLVTTFLTPEILQKIAILR